MDIQEKLLPAIADADRRGAYTLLKSWGAERGYDGRLPGGRSAGGSPSNRNSGLGWESATDLMHDVPCKLLNLDPAPVPVPIREPLAFSAYCGPPWEIARVSLEHLAFAISAAAQRLDQTEVHDGCAI